MKNPYASAQVVLKNGDPITELRFGKSNQRALSESSGEFNANDKKELIRSITKMFESMSNGDMVHQESVSADREREIQERREVVVAAMADSRKWEALGADLAVKIQEQRNREGFMRRCLIGQNLKQGELPRVNVPMWDAMSVVATGPANVQYQMIRNKQFYPNEFEIVGNLRADRLEMEQVGGDVLDNLYNMGLDSIMVKEDLLLKQAWDATVGVVNPLNYIAGQLTPQILASIRQGVTDWNLPATMAVISNDFWTDIIGNSDFSSMFDPVTKYDLVMNGELGTLVGLGLLTDGFRQPNQKVLNRGEIYVLTTPDHLGCYSDRGGVRSEPTTGADSGNTSRGWLLSEILSMTLANPRGVSKGKRI
jgi:hypothetical protein